MEILKQKWTQVRGKLREPKALGAAVRRIERFWHEDAGSSSKAPAQSNGDGAAHASNGAAAAANAGPTRPSSSAAQSSSAGA